MTKIAVVDDEDIYANKLIGYLEKYSDETKKEFDILRFSDGIELLEDYKNEYDIIFLDIQMKHMDGMTTAKKIREIDDEVIIIFITNMTSYAIQGYEVNAFDYIVKPVDYRLISEKLEKSLQHINKRQSPIILIKVQLGIVRLLLNDIYYIESEGHNLYYFTKNGVHKTRAKIQDAEENLKKHSFIRSSKSNLVNLRYVEAVEDGCCIINGQRLLISRSRKSEFMNELTNYYGRN